MLGKDGARFVLFVWRYTIFKIKDDGVRPVFDGAQQVFLLMGRNEEKCLPVLRVHEVNSFFTALVCSPISGTGPNVSSRPMTLAPGASISTGPDAVCTVVRSNCG